MRKKQKQKPDCSSSPMPTVDHSRHFFTHDVGCAAALKAVGYKLTFLDNSGEGRHRFVFENEDAIAETAVSYLSAKLALDAYTFYQTVRMREKRMHVV